MSEFIVERPRVVAITLRVPAQIWHDWEYRHRDFGKAIHALRENCIDIMGAKVPPSYRDVPDPFYREYEPQALDVYDQFLRKAENGPR